MVEPKPVEPPKDKAPDPEPPKKLTIGKEGQGRLQIGMLAQGWFDFQRASGKTTNSTFRLRRAEIAVKGEIVPKRWSFNVMVDPAKVREVANTTLTDSGGDTVVVKQPPAGTSTSILQDFYITANTAIGDLSIGQFKIPVSWEGYNSSAKLWFPERAPVSAQFGDKRDLGIRMNKQFKQWGYVVGVYNGQGANNLDTNVQKDVSLRLEVYPVPGLTLAGVTYDSIGIRNRAGTKDRWEGDARYEHGPYLIQAEYIRAKDTAKDNAGATPEQGFYATAGYMLHAPSLHGDLQAVARVGYLDLDADDTTTPAAGAFTEEKTYDVGLNYYIKGHEMKLQLAGERQTYDNMKPSVTEVTFAAQVWY